MTAPDDGYRYVSPPNWPTPQEGWRPPEGWQPDPEWGPAPEGWNFWEPIAPQPFVVPPPPSATQPVEQTASVPVAQPRGGKGKWVAVALAVLVGIGLISSLGGNDEPKKTSSPQTVIESQLPTDAPTEEVVEPTEEPTPEDTGLPVLPFHKADYKVVTPRTYALIVRNPNKYKGRKLLIYGRVTQFDSATGTEGFLADTDPRRFPNDDWYKYDHSALCAGPESILEKAVEHDIVRLYVTVVSDYSYDTQIGGNTTVPLLRVDRVTVVGHET